jgi:hypothetical protein
MTIRYGQIYKCVASPYDNMTGALLLLCQVGIGKMSLVSLSSGNRWSNETIVNNSTDLTIEEFQNMIPKEYVLELFREPLLGENTLKDEELEDLIPKIHHLMTTDKEI